LRSDDHLKRRGTYLVSRIRGGNRKRQPPQVGAPDAALTPNAGLAVITELCGRLGVIEAIDAAVGPVKQPGLRRVPDLRGFAPVCGRWCGYARFVGAGTPR
jgi:hypothetical protein